MQIINEQFLKDIGVVLSAEEVALLSDHFETTLGARIINEIADELDPQQAEALMAMADRNDPSISDWLVANVPALQDIIQDEVDILLGELVESKDSLAA